MIEFKDHKKLSKLLIEGRNDYQKNCNCKNTEETHENLAERIGISVGSVKRWVYAESQEPESANQTLFLSFIWLLLTEGTKAAPWLKDVISTTNIMMVEFNLETCAYKLFPGISVGGEKLSDEDIETTLKPLFEALPKENIQPKHFDVNIVDEENELINTTSESKGVKASETNNDELEVLDSLEDENEVKTDNVAQDTEVITSKTKKKEPKTTLYRGLSLFAISIMVIIVVGVIIISRILPTSFCGGETFSRESVQADTSQQLTLYNTANSNRAILHNRIRAVEVNRLGVWFGYHTSNEELSIAKLGFANRDRWAICQSSNFPIGQKLNDIVTTSDNQLWLITDGFGVNVFDGTDWSEYRTRDGLNDDRGYTGSIDLEGNLLVGTWQGVSEFTGSIWRVRYAENKNGQQNIYRNPVHALAFHPSGEVWVGHIWEGISRLRADGRWEHITAEQYPEALKSNNIRGIIIDNNGLVWIATDGGGVSRYNPTIDEWMIFTMENSSLIGDGVKGVAEDKYHRIWAYTSNGVSMFSEGRWIWITDIPVFDLTFGVPVENCDGCPYDDNHVWMATDGYGLAHRQIPANTPVVSIENVVYPLEVKPNQEFVPEITVRIWAGYRLSGATGDGLFFIGENSGSRFGAYPVIGIESPQSAQIIEGGETYTFSDRNNPFVAPTQPGTYESRWCIWYHSGCASEDIVIRFTVIP